MPYSNVTFNITTGRAFKVDDFVKVAANSNNYITGRVVSYNPSTGDLVVTPYEAVGSGTFSSWTATLTGFNGTAGTSGSSGTSGTVGTDGSSGTAGTSGTAATSGIDGFDGSAGTSGNTGSSAISGGDGSSGTAASSGTNGNSSSSGTSGDSGSSGTSGTSGSSASSGTSGNSGTSGSSGTAGSSGVTGSSATSGTNGITGPAGGPGPAGSPGPAGGPGPGGSPGPTGPTGPAGGPGSPGGPGGPGPTGPPGSCCFQSFNQGLNTYDSPSFNGVTLTYSVGYGLTASYVYVNIELRFGSNQGPIQATWVKFTGAAVYLNGFITATGYYYTSSRKYKENIQPFTQSAIEILNDTNVVRYELNTDEEGENPMIGFIAEDTNSILSGPEQNIMDIQNTIGLLIKGVQEIDARIVNLQNKKNNAS